MGPAPDERGRHHLGEPPGAGGGGHRVDPAGHRGAAAGGTPGAVVPGCRCGQPGLGHRGLDLRRGFRRHLRSRADLGLRRPGGRRLLRAGRRPAGLARPVVAGSPSRPADQRRHGALFPRDGRPAGLARTRLLAGSDRPFPRHARRHGGHHGPDAAAGIPGELGGRLRLLRRGPRVGGEPVPGDRPGRHRGGTLHRAPAADRGRHRRRHRPVPGHLGPGGGLRLLRRGGHRPELDDPDAADRGQRSGRLGSPTGRSRGRGAPAGRRRGRAGAGPGPAVAGGRD